MPPIKNLRIITLSASSGVKHKLKNAFSQQKFLETVFSRMNHSVIHYTPNKVFSLSKPKVYFSAQINSYSMQFSYAYNLLMLLNKESKETFSRNIRIRLAHQPLDVLWTVLPLRGLGHESKGNTHSLFPSVQVSFDLTGVYDYNKMKNLRWLADTVDVGANIPHVASSFKDITTSGDFYLSTRVVKGFDKLNTKDIFYLINETRRIDFSSIMLESVFPVPPSSVHVQFDFISSGKIFRAEYRNTL